MRASFPREVTVCLPPPRHCEDHSLYSVNFLHSGASKTWYAVRCSATKRFEKALRESVPQVFEEDPDVLHSLTTMLSPGACIASGVDVCRVVQNAGDFIVTYPSSFHAGFSHGFNCAEAVNIGDVSWLPMGRLAVETYSGGRQGTEGGARRPAIFSHERLVWQLTRCCRGLSSVVSLPVQDHAAVFAEASVLVKEQMQLRSWLRGLGVKEASSPPLSQSAAAEEVCYLCGALPYLASMHCTCERSIACLQHAFMQCNCRVDAKTLRITVPDSELLEVAALQNGAAAGPARASPAAAVSPTTGGGGGRVATGGKRSRGQVKGAAWNPTPGRCSECGGFPARGGLLHCMSCDADFHKACDDGLRLRSAGDVVLCPRCWDAQS